MKRQSIRLPYYDYSQSGYYNVTICAHNKQHLFGNMINGEMRLSEYGKIVQQEWLKTKHIRANVDLDEYQVMPNHVHGIIIINGRGTARRAPTYEQFGSPVSGSLPTIIRSFKSSVTKQINEIRGTPEQHVWQRNYYERVIRNERELAKIREYIINNPANWALDEYNLS